MAIAVVVLLVYFSYKTRCACCRRLIARVRDKTSSPTESQRSLNLDIESDVTLYGKDGLPLASSPSGELNNEVAGRDGGIRATEKKNMEYLNSELEAIGGRSKDMIRRPRRQGRDKHVQTEGLYSDADDENRDASKPRRRRKRKQRQENNNGGTAHDNLDTSDSGVDDLTNDSSNIVMSDEDGRSNLKHGYKHGKGRERGRGNAVGPLPNTDSANVSERSGDVTELDDDPNVGGSRPSKRFMSSNGKMTKKTKVVKREVDPVLELMFGVEPKTTDSKRVFNPDLLLSRTTLSTEDSSNG